VGAADATSGDASGAPAARAVQALRSYWQRGSGPAVAGVFHKLLALVFLDAWISLGVQVHVLVGSRGLLPLAAFLQAARVEGSPTFGDFPTLFWLGASDGTLTAGVLLGGALALAALAGARPRLCLGLSTALYLSFTVACRTFFSFQWDNLLLECGLLVLFLPADRRAPWAHWLFRVLLFKLYFESGIAKWQSHLGDWQDGSAMTFYYETAPLPTWLGWYLHALPAWWHHFESWATLVMELAVPFAFFGPRPARLAAAAVLTGFQTVNLASANYGFFVHLALALHVFLLEDRDVARAAALVRASAAATRARLARRWPALSGGAPSPSDGAPPPGAVPSRAGVAPTNGAEPSRAAVAPTNGAVPSRAGVAPINGGAPSRAGVAPTNGGAPLRAGVAPTSGGAPSRAGVAPINGGAPSRAGVAALPHGAPAGARAPAVTPRSAAADTELRRLRAVGAALFAAAYLFVSALEAWRAFGPRPTDIDVASGEPFEWLQEIYEPWRLVNTYHLFGHITTERIEPAFETFDGRDWTEHALRHKPGDTARAPDFVAPHQPRVDFQLWFYGLSFRGGMPYYVRTLLDRLCGDPDAVAGLFAAPLPPHPIAVRVAFWTYHFTTPAARRATGAWWTRERLGALEPHRCH
jgi:hypothetical protein